MFGFNFGGMGGFHMGGDDDDDQMHQEGSKTRFYELLRVPKEATSQQITAAFKKLSEEHQNDSDLDHEKLEQIKEAYEVLSDPKSRQLYDQFGEEGPSQADMMQMFLGGGGLKKGPEQKQKSQPLKQLLQLTLEQAYTGDNIKVPVKRYRLCKTCNGAGGSDVKKCTECKGRGHVIRLIPLGPGMMQQMSQACESCKGEGQIIAQQSKCKDCEAKQVKEEEVTLDVKVPKGISTQQPIVLAGEGHELPECLVGDAIFVVKVLPHEEFTRTGNDLYLKKDILLIEGLTGVVFNLTHLDKRTYTIESAPNQIIADKSKKVLTGLGMPLFKDPATYGNLIIEFHLIMPEKGSISQSSIQELATILPGTLSERPKDHHFQLLQDFDPAELNTNEEGGGGNEEDEEDQQGGGVQCAAQ